MLATRLARVFSQIPVELTKQGRYAYTLYLVAEQQKALDAVKEDMLFVKELYKESSDFQVLISNPSLKKQLVQNALKELMEKVQLSPTSINLINTLTENGRLKFLNEIADKYLSYHKLTTQRESVRVVSAAKLTSEEEKEVEAAMHDFNPSAKFDLNYEVDASLLGGLQLYFPTAFMDLSLRSRLEKIKEELSALAP